MLKLGLVELFREINSGRLESAIRLAHGWSLEETPSGTPSSGGEVSDPTGNRAVNVQRKDPTEQILRSAMESVDQYVTDLVKLSRDTQPLSGKAAMDFYDRQTEKERAFAKKLAPCASVLCDERAEDGHRHCDICNEYLEKHPGLTQVPRDTIAQRLKKRKQREAGRLHITGPLVEEIA